MIQRAILISVVAALASTACTKKSDDAPKGGSKPEPSASPSGEAAHDELPKHVQLKKEVIEAAKIRFAPIGKETLVATLTLPGEVSVDPDKSARVAAPVAGRLVRVNFREGSNVKKGDVLATLRVPEIGKVRSSYNAAVTKEASARANAERLQELAGRGMASTQESVAAKAEADALGSEAKGLAEQLSVLGLSSQGGGSEIAIYAPITGTVVSREAVVGQPASVEQTLATIADLSEVWFLARVFEKDLGRLRVGTATEIELNAYPKERFTGTVEYIARQVDPIARTVTARVRLDNRSDLLRLGLFGTAHVSDQNGVTKQPSLVTLRTAVVEIGNKQFVFVKQGDTDFEAHEVTLGNSALGKVEIVGGLREGENVVVEGASTLKGVMLKSSLQEDE